jgi:ATP-dependent Clp protease adaptor protein ClpS
MRPNRYFEEEEIAVEDDLTDLTDQCHLVVFNDDVNTFDWVIKSLVDICKSTPEQAEQLSLLIHFKGKATVKTAPKSILRPMREGLTERGIDARIFN